MVRWQDYAPASTSRVRESTEWSITYTFRAVGSGLPRVLLVGDSICNGYGGRVRDLLDGRVNVSFWASSKCVTDPDYFRELDLILGAYSYDMVCFNNGLHSLSTDRAEWEAAYRAAAAFIRAKLPAAKLSLTLTTPTKDDALTAAAASLNAAASALAAERGLPVIDLFSEMDGLDREEYWSDVFHFRAPAVDRQAGMIADHVLRRLGLADN